MLNTIKCIENEEAIEVKARATARAKLLSSETILAENDHVNVDDKLEKDDKMKETKIKSDTLLLEPAYIEGPHHRRDSLVDGDKNNSNNANANTGNLHVRPCCGSGHAGI